MQLAPLSRILLRYGVGLAVGWDAGQFLAGDPDLVVLLAGGIGAATETAYWLARRRGWAT